MEDKVPDQALSMEGTDRGVVADLLRDQPVALVLAGGARVGRRGSEKEKRLLS